MHSAWFASRLGCGHQTAKVPSPAAIGGLSAAASDAARQPVDFLCAGYAAICLLFSGSLSQNQPFVRRLYDPEELRIVDVVQDVLQLALYFHQQLF
jgi:hypothetical protein